MEIKLNEEQQLAFDNIVEFINIGDHKNEYYTLSGKAGCLALGTKVLMFDGRFKKVEDVIVGDQLMGVDSTPRNVLSLCRGREMMYNIYQRNGITYRVNENHILSIKETHPAKYSRITLPNGERKVDYTRLIHPKRVDVVNIPVKEYVTKRGNLKKHGKGYKAGILEFPEQFLPIDPYYLGLWLGDGTTSNINHITNSDIEVINFLKEKYNAVISGASKISHRMGKNQTQKFKKIYNLSNGAKIGKKYIPDIYLYNTIRKRKRLIAGLIDTDGYYDPKSNGYEITFKSQYLASQVQFILRSLGIYPKLAEKKASIGDIDYGIYYRLSFSLNAKDFPILIERRKLGTLSGQKIVGNTEILAEIDKVDDYYGFELDGDHLFMLEDFTVTHNTGKSTTLALLTQQFPNRRFIVCAVSHKAKENIARMVRGKNVKPMTIAALLAMKMDAETGNFKEDEWAQDIPISDADIVIIDEASMLDQKVIKYMFKKKLYRTVLIFAGDIGQIRPIREYAAKLGDVSPVFKSDNISFLNTRVRQGEGNPILKHMDYYWDMTLNPNPEFDELQRENEVNAIGKIVYHNNMKDVIKEYLPYFKKAIETQNTNVIKVVTYRNTIREKINVLVRKALYGEDVAEFEVGDLMIMTDTFQVDRYTRYENSLEFCITSFRKETKTLGEYIFDCFDVRGITESGSVVNIPILAEKDKEKFQRLVTKLYEQAREKQGLARRNAFADARVVQNTFAKSDFGYSLSAHRS